MSTSATPEAFLLLTLPNASLRTPTESHSGNLYLEYVTFSLPPSTHPTPETPDIFLVLRLGNFETVLDPTRTITQTENGEEHRYVFRGTQADGEMVLTLPSVGEKESRVAENLETFQSILAEYGDYRGLVSEYTAFTDVKSSDSPVSIPGGVGTVASYQGDEDLRGRFILMNEDNGQIIGALDNHIHVQEDPSLGQKGHENDPVVVELPEGADGIEQLSESEVLVRTVPAEERDWLFKGAVMASYVISEGTTLLATAMNSASNYYVKNTKPGQQQQPPVLPDGSRDPNAPEIKPVPPSRALLLLSSPTTRKHLTQIHAVSGQAVKLSGKTVAAVENMISRVVGGGSKSSPDLNSTSKSGAMGSLTAGTSGGVAGSSSIPGRLSPANEKPPLPPRKTGDGPPPPYYSASSATGSYMPSKKPQLPPRKSVAGSGSTSTSGHNTPVAEVPPALPARDKGKSKWGGVALSAALILSTLSESSTRIVDAGGNALSNAVAHKYGEHAGNNVLMAAGTVKNVALVYVDVRGFGRRAIVKKVAKTYVKGQIKSGKDAYLKGKEKAD